jgi:prepilin-type N-terminal cleavage/methylation domain-containing protein
MIGLERMHRDSLGFSLVELLIVIAILGILSGLALPPFLTWRANAQYRQAGNGLVAALRTARSTAIATNRQIALEVSGSAYRTHTGDRALASANWTAAGWTTLPPGVGFAAGYSHLIANPNGTFFITNSPVSVSTSAATAATVVIQDSTSTPAVAKNTVSVSQTGRISLTQSN